MKYPDLSMIKHVLMKVESTLLAVVLLLMACSKEEVIKDPPYTGYDYRQEMRDFVIDISQYGKALQPNFIIIPQNGIELASADMQNFGNPSTSYLNAIDANGQEDLFFGYNNDDEATPVDDNAYLRDLLDLSKSQGNTILVTDYCFTPSKMEDSYSQNASHGYVSFAADERELNNIPNFPNPINQENGSDINKISEVKNFLYLINPDKFASKNAFITAVSATNYDLIIMDLFFDEDAFTASEINALKIKANGGKRLVVSYMSIGEAEDYRYYWQASWQTNKPNWLGEENQEWAGNYQVEYWNSEWQNIFVGNDGSYLKKILDAQFDGVYLDLIAAFENYE